MEVHPQKNLNGAHNSMIDVQAQTDVVTHPYFHNFLDVTKSYELIENIVAASVRKFDISRSLTFTLFIINSFELQPINIQTHHIHYI